MKSVRSIIGRDGHSLYNTMSILVYVQSCLWLTITAQFAIMPLRNTITNEILRTK